MRTQDNTIDTCLNATEMLAYLKEELDGKSTSLVDQHLVDCELCCDALEALGEENQDGLGLEDMDVALNGFHEQLAAESVKVNEGEVEAAPIKKLRSTYLWRAAAAVLLIVSVVWFWQQSRVLSGEDLFISYYEPYEDLVSTRSQDAVGEKEMIAGIELYNASAYKQAAFAFEEVLKAREESDLARLYLGICYLSLNQEEKASAQLLQVIEGKGALTDIAHWYLGLSFLKLEDKEASRKHLNAVVEQRGVFKKEAQEILEKLD